MGRKKKPPQRARVTETDVNEMMRLKRQGQKIQDIARILGCHRQTVRLHLKGNDAEMLRAEAQKQIMIEAIKQHFRELAEAAKSFKGKFQASPMETDAFRAFPRCLALPGMGSPLYVAREWSRIHELSDRECHLMGAMQEHVPDSDFWDCWKEWNACLERYRKIGSHILEWLDSVPGRLMEVNWKVDREKSETVVQPWLYGNILRRAQNGPFERVKIVRRKDSEGTIRYHADTDILCVKGDRSLFELWLYRILEEALKNPLLQDMKGATEEIKERQPELRELARKSIFALEALQMMFGYPGRCHLCPV